MFVEKTKKRSRFVRLYFSCTKRESSCIYPGQTFFTIKSKIPKLWLHLMFLNLQAKSSAALRLQDSRVSSLSGCWDWLQTDRNDSFVRLVTASFPSSKEQQSLRQELWESRFFDVITLEPMSKHWSCFMCNNPEKLLGFIKPDGTPGITGQLKEKKGKWKLFKRWKKRHFTLSGDHITYQKTRNKLETLNVSHIESVRACRKKPRDVPRAFEIFTDDGASYKFKSNDHKNVERWVQCLNLALSKQRKPGRYHTVG
ncbi:VEPH1 [Bugula neritina]|uniref:VEPH1 n=1 Tax=Bugula neritina TaxID=10212 RepID=A0A7J7JYH3_BUGNE|nr:VEPH1 [Bugula neritina]